jgi:hypothetical protein
MIGKGAIAFAGAACGQTTVERRTQATAVVAAAGPAGIPS